MATRGTAPTYFRFIWTQLSSAWSFARNWVVTHHIPFFLLFAYTCVRIGVSTATTVFNAIYTSAVTSQQLITSNQGAGSGISALSYFGVVNSFFPVPETFTFLAAILSLRGALWVYVFARSVYKNIPFKAS